MGRGIAQLLAQSGHPVLLFDNRPGAVQEALAALRDSWGRLVDKGKMDKDAVTVARQMLYPVNDLRGLSSCSLVIEAIVEDLKTKQELFRTLENIVAPHATLATNTSSLSVTAIAAACQRPQLVAGLHFFNPVPQMKVVEIVAGARTRPDVLEKLAQLVRGTGHTPVMATDTPGFIVNHAGRGYGTEALRCLQENVADAVTIDRILRDQGGFRLGPFELFDLTALDVSHPVMESIYHQYYEEPRYRPSPITAQRLAAGLLGRKSGEGFYLYKDGAKVESTEQPASRQGSNLPVHIAEQHAGQRERLAQLLQSIDVKPLDQPSDDALLLIAPLGHDATTSAQSLGIDARRTVAVDLLKPDSATRRRVVMTTPMTLPAYRDAALALLSHEDRPACAIRDSAGFVTQRVLAMIINIACDICQQRITSPAELELAVTLGLGYPQGPLAMGDALGPARVLQVLQGIHACTQDPRYRPSPWLRRRAQLGLSLLHVEA
jgi:3-hydroxybutyryl-CoA dehydrogenase